MKLWQLLVYTIILAAFCACTRSSQYVDDSGVTSLVENRSGYCLPSNCTDLSEEDLQAWIDCLLQEELTAQSATQIALLNNPRIQALLMELGIAYADWIEAGLLPNPFFTGTFRTPNRGGNVLNIETFLTQNITGILLLPLRKKVAAAEWQQSQLEVAYEILEIIFAVQKTCCQLQAAQIKKDLLELVVDAFEGAKLLCEEQFQNGNTNILDLLQCQTAFAESTVELRQSFIEIVRLRAALNKLLGLCPSENSWRLASQLPPPPCEEISLECLESLALSERLDLQAGRWEISKLIRLVDTQQWWVYTNLGIGISNEQDPDGLLVTGPFVETALPIFDYGQADRTRLFYLIRQKQEFLKQKEIDILAELQAEREILLANRSIALSYQNQLLPLQKSFVDNSEIYYNAMAMNIYTLLAHKREQLKMEISQAMALRDYWISQIDLNRILGGALFTPSLSCSEQALGGQ
jgi:outer membrane protein, heavy metal efflux system